MARRGLVSLNQLDYVLQPDLSVAVSRNMKRHFFQRTKYSPGTDAICILNSGADYIDPQHSYLTFDVKCNGKPMALGSGSGLNFIERVILTTRSGDELERVADVNKLSKLINAYTRSSEWHRTTGSMMGYSELYDSTAPVGVVASDPTTSEDTAHGLVIAPGDTQKHRFVIPMSELFGLFRSFDRLLPSMLCSGLRIEIHWADGSDVGFSVGTPVAAVDNVFTHPPLQWEVSDVSIMADSYQLTDSIQRVLNEEASIKGLEMVFSSWYHHATNTGESGAEVNIELRKAVSRALGVLHQVGYRGTTNGPTIDPFLSKPILTGAGANFQLRLGSMYFPQQPVTNKQELYHHTLRGWGKLKTPSAPGSVSMNQFMQTSGCVYTDLERSTTQKLTGVPVNNSRIIEIRGKDNFTVVQPTKFNQIGQPAAYTHNIWLHYVRLARVFLQNVEVEE